MPVRVPPVGVAADTASNTTDHDQTAPLPDPCPLGTPGSATASPSGRSRAGEEERRRELQTLDPEALRALAVSMPVIEQAKGIVMGCYGCDATVAFAVLNRLSSSRQTKLRDLAALVVDAASGPPEPTTSSAPSARPAAWERVRLLLQGGPEHDLRARS